jgi:hypothetical protein
VVVALAVTGLALSQTSPPPTPKAAGEVKEHTLTVQEKDKPDLKCRLLKTWRLPDGHKAYLAQALTTGEFITIAESADPKADAKSDAKGVSTKIYHWGDKQSPPAGAPEVPNNALVLGNAVTPPVAKVTPAPAPSAAGAHNDVPKVTPAPTPSVPPAPTAVARNDAPKVVPPPSGKQWPSAFASTPADAEPVKITPTPAVPTPTVVVKQPEAKPIVPPSTAPTQAKTGDPTAVTVTPKPADNNTVVTPPPLVVVTPKPADNKTVAPPVPPSPLVIVTPKPADNKGVVVTPPTPVTPVNPPAPAVVKAPEVKPAQPTFNTQTPVAAKVEQPGSPPKPPVPPTFVPIPTPTVAKAPSGQPSPTVAPTTPAQPAVAPTPAPVVTKAPPPDYRASWGNTDAGSVKVAKAPATTSQVLQPSDPLASPDRYVKLPTEIKPETKSTAMVAQAQGSKPTPVATVSTPTTTAPTPPQMMSGPSPAVASASDKIDYRKPVVFPQVVAKADQPAATPSAPTITKVTDMKPVPPTAAKVEQPASPPRPPAPAADVTAPVPPRSVAAAMETPRPPQGIKVVEGGNAFGTPAPPSQGNVAQQQQQPQMNMMQPSYPTARPPIVYEPPMDQGVAPSAGNAFTRPSTARPIPANFGPQAQIPNAFNDGNTVPTQAIVYNQPAMRPSMSSPMDRPTTQARMTDAGAPVQGPANPPQMMAILRDSLLPTQRESAAESLGGCNWRTQPQVVDALMKAAKEDPAPMVRAECLRSLGRLGANTVPVVATCRSLQDDQDARVRKEADHALAILVGETNADGGVKRASMESPK